MGAETQPEPLGIEVNQTSELDRARRCAEQARAEAAAATGLAARLAHVLHAVDLWAGDKTVRGPGAAWERRQLRAVLAVARASQQLTDPDEPVPADDERPVTTLALPPHPEDPQ